jgi:Helix-turn-helix domain
VNVRELFESRGGSELARRRALLLVKNLRGELTMAEVGRELGVNEAMAYRYREQFLEGAIEGLEPRALGRPATESSEEIVSASELEVRVKELERELRVAKLREELLREVPELGRKKKPK